MSYNFSVDTSTASKTDKLTQNKEVIDNKQNQGLSSLKEGQQITGTVVAVDEKVTLDFSGQEVTTSKSMLSNVNPGDVKTFEVVKATDREIELRVLDDTTAKAMKTIKAVRINDSDWNSILAKNEQALKRSEQEAQYRETKTKLEQINSILTEQDCKLLEENGFQLEKYSVNGLYEAINKIKTSVVEADRNMASKMTSFDETALTRRLKEENLPVTEENITKLKKALEFSESISYLNGKSMQYLISSNAEPSAENIYKANYSGINNNSEKLSDAAWKELEKQVSEVVKAAGYEINKENIADAKWLVENKIPLTEDTFAYKKNLDAVKSEDKDEILNRMLKGMKNGINPKDVALIPKDHSTCEQVIKDINTISDGAVTQAVKEGSEFTIKKLINIQDRLISTVTTKRDATAADYVIRTAEYITKSSKEITKIATKIAREALVIKNSTNETNIITKNIIENVTKSAKVIEDTSNEITKLVENMNKSVAKVTVEAVNIEASRNQIPHEASNIIDMAEEISKRAVEIAKINKELSEEVTGLINSSKDIAKVDADTGKVNPYSGDLIKVDSGMFITKSVDEIIQAVSVITQESMKLIDVAQDIVKPVIPSVQTSDAQQRINIPSYDTNLLTNYKSAEVTNNTNEIDNFLSEITKLDEKVTKTVSKATEADSEVIELIPNNVDTAKVELNLSIIKAVVDNTQAISDIAKAAMKLTDVAHDIERSVTPSVQTETTQTIAEDTLLLDKESELESKNQADTNTNPRDLQYQELKARRQMEEIRLKMTLEAAGQLEKKGFSIDTEELSKVVHELRELEDNYYKKLLKEADVEVSDLSVQTLKETTQSIERLKYIPCSVLGSTLAQRSTQSITGLLKEGSKLKTDYEKAGTAYETLMTVPNSEYGDSIKKAFANANTLLAQMNLDNTEQNQRAIRILGYNQMEINEEKINQVKAYDKQVTDMIQSLHPAVTVQMIREGINPLEMSMNELNRTIDQIKEERGISSEDKYSTYLRNLEKQEGITEEERKAYIGIYRLLYNVEKSDGAAVGSVLKADREVTLGNLLTAIQTSKKGSLDTIINDEFGTLESITYKSENIAEQLQSFPGKEGQQKSGQSHKDSVQENSVEEQTEYLNRILKQVKDELTPQKLMEASKNLSQTVASQNQSTAVSKASSERGVWEYVKGVSIEKLLEQIQMAEDVQTANDETYVNKVQEFRTLSRTAEQSIRFLNDYRLPNTSQNIMMANHLLNNGDSPIKKLFKQKNENQVENSENTLKEINDLSDTLVDKSSMQEIYEQLETDANANVTQACSEEIIDSKKLAELKSIGQQMTFIKTLAEKEFYQIPIETDRGITNLNLTILRGTETSGKLSVTVWSEQLGNIKAEFSLKDQVLKGFFSSDNRSGLEQLQKNTSEIERAAQECNIAIKQMDFGVQRKENESYSYQNPENQVRNTAVSNETERVLYQIAKAIVQTVRMSENGESDLDKAVS